MNCKRKGMMDNVFPVSQWSLWTISSLESGPGALPSALTPPWEGHVTRCISWDLPKGKVVILSKTYPQEKHSLFLYKGCAGRMLGHSSNSKRSTHVWAPLLFFKKKSKWGMVERTWLGYPWISTSKGKRICPFCVPYTESVLRGILNVHISKEIWANSLWLQNR